MFDFIVFNVTRRDDDIRFKGVFAADSSMEESSRIKTVLAVGSGLYGTPLVEPSAR